MISRADLMKVKTRIENPNGFVNGWLPFRPDVVNVTGHRPPTPGEIKFGHGATHYKDFPRDVWEHPNGKLKRWIKCQHDGLRYYR